MRLHDCSVSATDAGACAYVTGAQARTELRACQMHNCTHAAVQLEAGASANVSGGSITMCQPGLLVGHSSTVLATDVAFDQCSAAADVAEAGTCNLNSCAISKSMRHGVLAHGSKALVHCLKCSFVGSLHNHVTCTDAAAATLQACSLASGGADAASSSGAGTKVSMSSCSVQHQAGSALRASDGAAAHMTACNVTKCHLAGICSGDGTRLALADSTISGCAGAVHATDAAVTDISKCTLRGMTQQAALCANTTAMLQASACIIYDCAEGSICVRDGASASIDDCQTHSSGASCMHADGQNSHLAIQRCAIKQSSGSAICCSGSAHVSASACTVQDALRTGAMCTGQGSEMQLADCKLLQCGADSVAADDQARLALSDCELLGTNSGNGVLASGSSIVSIERGAITQTHHSACQLQSGAQMQCSSVTMEGSRAACGILVHNNTALAASDTTVSGHASHGIVQLGKSSVSLVRCRCAANHYLNSTSGRR